MNIEIPDFLIEMSKQINEQNNRITAEPVWQVRCNRWRVTAEGYSDDFEIYDDDNSCIVAKSYSHKSINKQILDYCADDADVELPAWIYKWSNEESLWDEDASLAERVEDFLDNFDHETMDMPEEFNLVYVEKYEDVVKGAFLTEADANWFIQRKQHDYPKLYTYVESMTFCPQMIELRNWIKNLTEAA